MLGDYQPQRRQVVDLSVLDAVGLVIRQRALASRAFLHPVDRGVIGLVDRLERMPLMAGLTAGLALAFLAQAFGLGFLQAIGGWWSAAVARVLGQLVFQLLHPLFADLQAPAQLLHLLHQSVAAGAQILHYTHHGIQPGMEHSLCLCAAQHAHNSRRKSLIRGYR